MNPDPDYPRLRGWLGLPPGPWPPDHYALLGLPPGGADPAAVEARVLERMDRLRTHQLMHPELVTEGMNRLAQALVCLTDPAAKAAHDTEYGIVPAPPPAPLPYEVLPPYEVVEPDAEVVFRPGMVPPDESGPVGVPGDAPHVIEVPFRPGFRPPGPVKAYEVVEDRPAPPVDLPPEGPPPLPVAIDKASRRRIYRKLAVLRRGLRAWAMLRPVFADPHDRFDRPGRVLLLLDAAEAVKAALPGLRDVVGRPGRPGGLVAAVVGNPFPLHTIRQLLLDQRQAVGLDWRRGELALQREYRRLREAARLSRPHRPPRRDPRAVWQRFRETPELVLVVLAVLAVLAAALRGGR